MITTDTSSSKTISSNQPIVLLLLDDLTSKTADSSDLTDLFSFVLSTLKSHFKSNQLSIITFDTKNQKPNHEYQKIGIAGVLKKNDIQELQAKHDIVRTSIATRITSFAHTHQDNKEFAPEGSPLTTKIGIPFFYNGKVYGCINIACSKPPISDNDIVSLGALIGRHLDLHCREILGKQNLAEFKSRTRKLLNAKISELKDALDIADKYNQSLKDFSYIVSHDLREPLRTISSYIKLLDRRYQDTFDKDAKDFMYFVTNGVARMDALIKDLLAFSRVEHSVYQFEEIPLEKIMMLVTNSLRLKIEETSADISFDNPPIIRASRSHINILFQNLIDNAIKFRKTDEVPIIQISAKELENHWQFSVSDNGIGMNLEHKNNERIFKIFQRLHGVDSEIPGTGIGLAICNNIVQAHGGKIWVSSQVGVGSEFHFTISKK